VFVSSVITGFGTYRDAAVAAITNLGCQDIRAEDFPASPQSPRLDCLAAVRGSDALVLILGASYGEPQQSGLSATHEEYREAKGTIPVLAFVQNGVSPEPLQKTFMKEVRNWESGLLTPKFTSPEDLKAKVTRALHDLIVNTENTPLDTGDIVNRAMALIPTTHTTSGAGLSVAVAGGPHRTVLRPAELDSNTLHRFLVAEALTGDHAVLTPTDNTSISVRDNRILLEQNYDRSVSIGGTGDVLIVQPARENQGWHTGIPSLIEEDIAERITRAFLLAARLLDRVDGPQRLTHFAPVVGLRGAHYLPWRTRAEHQRSPNHASMGLSGAFGMTDPIIVTLSPPVLPRPALLNQAHQTAEDFTVSLRWKLRR